MHIKYPWFKSKSFSQEYLRDLTKIIKSQKMTMGLKSLKFENQLKKHLKVKHVILTTSGTSALLMATLASDIKNKETVVTNNFTWVATSNPAKILGANIKLVDTKKILKK